MGYIHYFVPLWCDFFELALNSDLFFFPPPLPKSPLHFAVRIHSSFKIISFPNYGWVTKKKKRGEKTAIKTVIGDLKGIRKRREEEIINDAGRERGDERRS